MELEERVRLVMSVGEEIVTESELRALLAEKRHPVAYDGFEPSGQMHIAQGLLRAININKMTRAGCLFKMWVADWHAWANNKMGGDLAVIQKVGEYFIEVWRAAGMDLGNVKFLWASEAVKDENYWKKVMNVARSSSLDRVIRTTQIMGRSEKEKLSAAQILYPCMQAADIFHLEADITQLGMDQRKVNMLARELGPELGFWKPVVVSHHMLMGLQQTSHEKRTTEGKMSAQERVIATKMSKSNPDSAIFMTDGAAEVERKLAAAYCPAKQAEGNPVLEYCKHIVFERLPQLKVEREQKFGGDIAFASYAELEAAFAKGQLHPQDLKKATAGALNQLLEPVRKHFAKGKARELLEFVEAQKVTR
ncbi:MAG TPA: tyrosine--tRNA ligase [archaeon]|nr:tyrosine--tRNA ligase [archaeon]